MSTAMHRVRAAESGAVVAERLRPAHSHWARLRGLLGTRTLPAGEGLWLKPCRQVHMFGMRYAVDLVFLDDEHRIVHTVAALAPWKVSPSVPAATSVVELPVGTLERAALRPGMRLEIDGGEAGVAGAGGTLGPVLCNLALAALYVRFAAAHVLMAERTGYWATTMPLVVQEAMLVVLFLTRRRALGASDRPLDWALGIAGTFLPLLMRPTDPPGATSVIGQPVMMVGLVFAVVAVWFLGRSIGVVAANRGIKTQGIYRLVRHPMYAAYLISYLGYALSNPSLRNVVITAAAAGALAARALVEERFLQRDPAYRDYLGQTRWRFVPFVV